MAGCVIGTFWFIFLYKTLLSRPHTLNLFSHFRCLMSALPLDLVRSQAYTYTWHHLLTSAFLLISSILMPWQIHAPLSPNNWRLCDPDLTNPIPTHTIGKKLNDYILLKNHANDMTACVGSFWGFASVVDSELGVHVRQYHARHNVSSRLLL